MMAATACCCWSSRLFFAVPSAAGRLTAFGDQVERLRSFAASLAALEHFRQEQGSAFQALRDFYNRMVNANAALPEVNTFLGDYRTVSHEQTITEPVRWNELNRAYLAAQQVVEGQVAAWRQQITARLAEVNDELEAAVRQANVPEERVRDEAAAVSLVYEPVRRQVERNAVTFSELRSLLSQMATCEMAAQDQLRELRARYSAPPPAHRRHVTWQELAGGPRLVNDTAEVDALLASLRERIEGYLADRDTHGLEIA